MRDRDIVAAIVASDPDGLAQAYDKYAARLFGFCRSRLREPTDAADAVQDTFLIAAARLDQLPEPDRLRPWLYAVARHECRRRLRAGDPPAALGEATELDNGGADANDLAARAQLRDLVRAAILGLGPADQEIIELSLRHDLYGPDLADVLGVPHGHAHALATRARGQLEESLGVLLVTLASREACPDLDQLLADWDGALTGDVRKLVSRHTGLCPVCGERQRRELQPIMRLGFAPLAIIPAPLRAQLLELAGDPSATATAERTAIVQRAGQFRADGFPGPAADPGPAGTLVTGAAAAAPGAPGAAAAVRTWLDRAGQRWPRARRRGTVIGGSAATAAVVGAIAVLVMVLPQATHQGRTVLRSPRSTATSGGRPTATPGHSQPATARPEASSSAAGSLAQQQVSLPASAGHGAPGTAAGDAPGAAAASGGTTPATGPATSAPASAATVAVSPSTLALTGLLGSATGTLTLTAGSSPVSRYSVSVPSSLAGQLTVSPASGSIPAHGRQRVTVTLKGLLSVDTTITVNPGGHPVTVLLGVHLGG